MCALVGPSIQEIENTTMEIDAQLSDTFDEQVKLLLLPFLRRTFILFSALSCSALPEHASFEDLLKNVVNKTGNIVNLYSSATLSWLANLLKLSSPFQLGQQDHIMSLRNRLVLPKRFCLFQLESSFQDLLAKYSNMKCPRCNTEPSSPVICLLCGKFLCLTKNNCCTNPDTGMTEGTEHILECGGGKSILILVRSCLILLVRGVQDGDSIGCVYPSVYLDKYGEEDAGFRRGKPLFLSAERVEHLRNLWLMHELEAEVVVSGQRRYRL